MKRTPETMAAAAAATLRTNVCARHIVRPRFPGKSGDVVKSRPGEGIKPPPRAFFEKHREAVAQWLHVYHHVRPHEALGWLTPAEKRAENLGIELNKAA